MSNLSSQFRSKVSIPWLLLTLVFVTFIWGNSLVPGQGSGSLSLSVMECAHEVLRSLGFPYAWLTNFIIRKTAHFTEYLVLGLFASQAFDRAGAVSRASLVATAVFCAFIPSIDETIQLFVADRSGQVVDVLLDCCGAATGIVFRTAWIKMRRGRNNSR